VSGLSTDRSGNGVAVLGGGTRGPAGPVLRIDARPERVGEWLRSVWGARALLVALAHKDFRVRYKRASLGILWSVALPVLQSAVMVFIFSRVGHFGNSHFNYAGFVLSGMVPWLYVSTSLLNATTSIVDSSGLTDKVFFPRAILPLVSPASNLVSLGVSTAILLVALPIVGQPITLRFLLVFPAIALLCAFTSALALGLGALYVYFRDVKFMVAAAMLLWIYVTPIVYPPSALKSAAPWLDFNPLTGIVGLFERAAVGAPVPSARALLVSVVATLVLGIVAVVAHRRHDRLFVDLL
jgi:ABC-type polysaccharide/polyol phosphate export permease